MQHSRLTKVPTALTYQDVLLVPQYSNIRSRSEVDISARLQDGLTLQIPIISSPMDTVSESVMADAMSSLGGLSIIHRYNTPEEQARLVRESGGLVGAAIGMTGDYQERTQALSLIHI